VSGATAVASLPQSEIARWWGGRVGESCVTARCVRLSAGEVRAVPLKRAADLLGGGTSARVAGLGNTAARVAGFCVVVVGRQPARQAILRAGGFREQEAGFVV